MRTRSQSIAILDELKIEIDFDEASNAWMANKRRLPNGCYQYVCGTELKSGKRCQKRPLLTEEHCRLHKPSLLSICKNKGNVGSLNQK